MRNGENFYLDLKALVNAAHLTNKAQAVNDIHDILKAGCSEKIHGSDDELWHGVLSSIKRGFPMLSAQMRQPTCFSLAALILSLKGSLNATPGLVWSLSSIHDVAVRVCFSCSLQVSRCFLSLMLCLCLRVLAVDEPQSRLKLVEGVSEGKSVKSDASSSSTPKSLCHRHHRHLPEQEMPPPPWPASMLASPSASIAGKA